MATVSSGIICVGDNRKRQIISWLFVAAHRAFNFITAVHPRSCVSRHAVVGAGTVVMAGAVINSGCIIGNHCIVNTSASIDHHCNLADYSSVAPGGTLGRQCYRWRMLGDRSRRVGAGDSHNR